MKEFFKEQFESFIDTHRGIMDDLADSFKELNLKTFGINLLAIIILSVLWWVNLFLYIGSAVVIGSILMFKYIKTKIRNMFNG